MFPPRNPLQSGRVSSDSARNNHSGFDLESYGNARWNRRSELMLGTLSATKKFWSVDHVSYEAIAALADGNLHERAHDRAREHISECAECAEQLQAQLQARTALRDATHVQMPHELWGTLCAIPQESGDSDSSGRRRPGMSR